MKRKNFYISTEVWERGLGSHSVAVYAFLSFCADRSGCCFPAKKEIARRCGISVKTVDKALRELADNGLVVSENRFSKTPGGGMRKSSNLYRLVLSAASRHESDAVSEPEPIVPSGGEGRENCALPLHPSGGEGSVCGAYHINNNIIKCADESVGPSVNKKTGRDGLCKKGVSAKVSGPGQTSEGGGLSLFDIEPRPIMPLDETEDPELEELLYCRLNIHIYEDKSFASAVEMAVRDMWFAPSITVCGETIPRARVRQRLLMMDMHCMDTLAWKMHELAGNEITKGGKYLASCIYNLPAEVKTEEAVFFADLRRCRELTEQGRGDGTGGDGSCGDG